MSGLSNGQQAILMLLVFILPVWVTWTANSSPLDRTAVSLLISATLSGVLAFIKELLGGKPAETTASTVQPSSPARTQLFIRRFPSKFKIFLSAFAHDTVGMAGRHRRRRGGGKYDPAPRRKGPRRGVEPAGLKRWRLSHRRTHDPGYQSTFWRGPRGGHYFAGPKKKRYDPQPRRRRWSGYWTRHPRQRGVAKGIEGTLNRFGTALGLALGLGAGVYQGYQNNDKYMKANGFTTGKPDPTGATTTGGRYINLLVGSKAGPPEIGHLVTTTGVWNPMSYLKYKFLGIDPSDTTNKVTTNSAWVIPFWVSFGTWLATTVGLKIGELGKMHRFLRPINKIAKGSTIGSLIGALALPGCGNVQPGPPTPQNTMSSAPQNPEMRQFTYTG